MTSEIKYDDISYCCPELDCFKDFDNKSRMSVDIVKNDNNSLLIKLLFNIIQKSISEVRFEKEIIDYDGFKCCYWLYGTTKFKVNSHNEFMERLTIYINERLNKNTFDVPELSPLKDYDVISFEVINKKDSSLLIKNLYKIGKIKHLLYNIYWSKLIISKKYSDYRVKMVFNNGEHCLINITTYEYYEFLMILTDWVEKELRKI